MKHRRRLFNVLGILLLGVAVSHSLKYWPQRLPLMPAEQDTAASNEPDYRITNFHAIDLDENGRLRYELTAEQLTHYPQPERAELTAPQMVFYRNTSADTGASTTGTDAPASQQQQPVAVDPWQLTAVRGSIADGGDRLDLEGDVRVSRAGTGGDRPGDMGMTLETARLTVFGKQEVATTDSPVFLNGDRAQLHGVGMQIDLKKGQMHLLSQVRGYYVPR
ncbi:MAG: LPS export ABC transporter periplasmic protein LptC [Gammaproteobacteria bacterium]